MANGFRPGDQVIYSKTKFSRRPGPRAVNVRPSSNGDSYAYVVDKFWVVQSVAEDGSVTLCTRTGKTHTVAVNDPLLRRANFWERWRYRNRFNNIANETADESGGAMRVA